MKIVLVSCWLNCTYCTRDHTIVMFSIEAHRNWKKEPHGKRKQDEVMSFILEKLELCDCFSHVLFANEDSHNESVWDSK